MRTVMAVAAVLGGLCWIAALWMAPLGAVGAVLLALAVVGAGAGLASRSATWLRVIAGVCFLGLVASVLLLLRDAADDGAILTAAGVTATLVGVVVLSRTPTHAHRGSHAA